MIKTVIFDIGRVLIGFEWKDYVHRLFGNPEVEARVTDATFGSGIWNEMDRGAVHRPGTGTGEGNPGRL